MTGPSIFVAIFAGIGVLAIVLAWLSVPPRPLSNKEKRARYLLWWWAKGGRR